MSTERRVILVALNWHRPGDPRIPLGHASLLAALRETSVEVQPVVADLNHPGFDVATFAAHLVDLALDLPEVTDVAVGVYDWNDALTRRVMTELRTAGFCGRIILGGPQISYAGPGLETLYPEADAFIRGYAEQALCAVATCPGRPQVPGVHWAGTQDRQEIAAVDLAVLPSPLLSGVLPAHSYVRWETRRGCPYRCSFCQHREAGHRQLARRGLPAGRIAKEVELLVQRRPRVLNVLDPIFNLPPSEGEADPEAVLQDLQAGGFDGHISLQCRFERVDEGFLDALDGLDATLEFGLQTIHPEEGRIIQRLNKLPLVDRAIQALHQKRRPFEVSLIFGLPGQTLESFRQSVQYCLDQGVPTIKAFPLMLLRGTPLADQKATFGLVESNDPIPMVVESPTFSRADHAAMAALAQALDLTAGAHPASVDALVPEAPAPGRWSPMAWALRS